MNVMQNTLSLPATASATRLPRSARAVLRLLEKIGHGTLEVRVPDGAHLCFGNGGSSVTLHISDWAAVSYTHLDVYKRQAQPLGVMRPDQGQNLSDDALIVGWLGRC